MKILALIGALTIAGQNPAGVIKNENDIFLQNIYQLKKPNTWENFIDNIATIYSREHRGVRMDKFRKEESIKNITELYKDSIIDKVGDLVDGFVDIETKNEVYKGYDISRQYNPEVFPVNFMGHRAVKEVTTEESWHIESALSLTARWSVEGNSIFVKTKYGVEISLTVSGGYSHTKTESFKSERYVDGGILNLQVPPKKTLKSVVHFYEGRGLSTDYATYRVRITPNQYANLYFNSARDNYKSTNVIRIDIGSYILKMIKLNPSFFSETSGDLFIINLRTNTHKVALPIEHEYPLGISTDWKYTFN